MKKWLLLAIVCCGVAGCAALAPSKAQAHGPYWGGYSRPYCAPGYGYGYGYGGYRPVYSPGYYAPGYVVPAGGYYGPGYGYGRPWGPGYGGGVYVGTPGFSLGIGRW